MLERLKSMLAPPQPIERPSDEQRRIDEEVRPWRLYHYDACPFCVRVRRVLQRLSLEIELRDVRLSREHRRELLEGGGRTTVPCLRLPAEERDGSDRFMYESADIIAFLERRFGG